jgi:hypothetical protein
MFLQILSIYKLKRTGCAVEGDDSFRFDPSVGNSTGGGSIFATSWTEFSLSTIIRNTYIL